jgi:hypothetical protein
MFAKFTRDIFAGFKKFLTMERVVVLIIFLILMWALVTYTNNKTLVVDKMEGGVDADAKKENKAEPMSSEPAAAPAAGEASGYSVKEVANPKDLLPNDENSQWAALNPNAANKGDMGMPDLLKAGQHIGLDTVGQSLRNANLQLRSDPVIAKSDIGPWNQSTIEGDYARVPLELGAK